VAGVDNIQRGAVRVFFSSTKWVSGASKADTDADITLYGGDQFAWFGSSLATAHWHNQSVLLVGAPGYRSNNGSTTVGRLSGFALTGGSASLAFTLTGDVTAQQSKLGAAVAVSSLSVTSMLAVSAPTYHDGGRVVVLPLNSVPAGDTPLSVLVSAGACVLQSCEANARFGWRLLFDDVSGDGVADLVVTAPMHTVAGSSGLFSANRHVGGVYVYYGGSSFPSGLVLSAEDKASWWTQGSTQSSRLGWAVAVGNVTGAGATTRQVVTASPFESAVGEMSGTVSVF
jgi:hypothetical protein